MVFICNICKLFLILNTYFVTNNKKAMLSFVV